MTGILVVAETRRGALREVSTELVSAAAAIAREGAGPVTVALIGEDAQPLREAVDLPGVDAVLCVPVPVAQFEPHVWQHAVERLIDVVDPSVVLLGHTVDSLGFGPAVAACGGLGLATDVVGVAWEAGGPVARRGAFGDKVGVELDFPGRARTLLMIRPGAFPAAAGAGSAEHTTLDPAPGEPAPTEHLGYREVPSGGVDITKATFLLSVGRGIEDEAALPRFEALAGSMGATLSVSRPLVDAGWVSNARQVGQSGKTVKPAVYLALGISGAVQHLAGMRGADTIIAVNSDPDAPIFSVAHYGVVADLFEVAEGLEAIYGR